MQKIKIFWTRLTQVEYWPFWIFYGPFIPRFLWYGLQNRSLLHFLVVNPGIKNSGCFNFSKYDLLKQLALDVIPETQFIADNEKELFIQNFHNAHYPIIIKPDKGSRGRGVRLVRNKTELQNALSHPGAYLAQAFIDTDYEFGVFYYHIPDKNEYGITGINGKKYLRITGDGVQTLSDHLKAHPRAKGNLSYFNERFSDMWDEILPKDHVQLIEEIGNHNRGTTFIDQSDLITDTLIEKIHEIAQCIDGFYWGRFDIKTASIADLQAGRGLYILEVNGGSSEPGHMFDPSYSWFDVRRTIIEHLKLHKQITRSNLRRGVKVPPWRIFIAEVRQYFKNKKDQLD